MPLDAISENPKFSQILSGPFWSFSIQKRDMGSDLNNFYPDDGYSIFIYIYFFHYLFASSELNSAQFLFLNCSGDYKITVLILQ